MGRMPADPLTLDLSPSDDTEAGFRLERVEVLNWGTFTEQVWSLQLSGRNTLLTGDIGSGKSTIVDAVTTLLVPAHRVAYNKAAGAETRERTLRSYVLGHYKSERNDTGGTSKPVALRDFSKLSVILGVFTNRGFGQSVTLAQVFWFRDPAGPPSRLYIGADTALSIAEHFTAFGADITGLRKRLRSQGAEVNESFPPYGAWLRRHLGIASDQALELFHQTVSMKSVGNLTDFVRTHMLDPGDPETRIRSLLEHFDDLTRAHDAILKAKRQVELLTPLVDECDRLDELERDRDTKVASREALRLVFDVRRQVLLRARIDELEPERDRHMARLVRHDAELVRLNGQRDMLKADLARNGGDRLVAIDSEIQTLELERDERRKRHSDYVALCRAQGIAVPADADSFDTTRVLVRTRLEELDRDDAALQNEITDSSVALQRGRDEHDGIAAELESLRSRTSNLPREQVAMRDRLCAALGLAPDDLPYAGELLRVREGQVDWEGAAERVLRPFALSMLVSDTNYRAVQTWVDRTDLRGRIVYYRVLDDPARPAIAPALDDASLARKIEVRDDVRWKRWLRTEVNRRFDYTCSSTHDDFRRARRAVTLAGQVKGGDERHEKDDRHALDDRRRYVLGWSNADKIRALDETRRELAARLGEVGAQLAENLERQRDRKASELQLRELSFRTVFDEIDWQRRVHDIQRRRDERERLTATADALRALQDEIATTDEAVAKLGIRRDDAARHHDRAEQEITQRRGDLAALDSALALHDLEKIAAHDRVIDVVVLAQGIGPSTLRSVDEDERKVRDVLQSDIDAVALRVTRSTTRIERLMTDFRHEFPAETTDFDASVDSAGSFRDLLAQLAADDLPRYEERFKQLLNENTIREIANFQSQLHRQQALIRERIAAINTSLVNIDYNPGRYIALEPVPTDDAEVRDFRSTLRSCTEGTLTGSDDEHYAEQKFQQIRELIGRFQGREGLTELDRRWTAKVTDVRNWFTFAGSERWREDDVEHEHYSDSSGKSGGQKEKLAYTVLAASLAYQFGLEWGETRSRSFRFVVIDEAFGRGSDDSARYGLELFGRLNLQLLVVTPLQKIHVIEPYVHSVGFVHNHEGRDSRIRNLSIAEYHDEKARRRTVET
jgi:uncharacterized protein YPO0396